MLLNRLEKESVTPENFRTIMKMLTKEAVPGSLLASLLSLAPVCDHIPILIEYIPSFIVESNVTDIDYVIQFLLQLVEEDRTYLMPVLGALGDLSELRTQLYSSTIDSSPKQIISQHIFNLCTSALAWVSEDDLPTLVRTLCFTLTPHSAHEGFNALRKTTERFDAIQLSPVLPVLYNALRMSSRLVELFLQNINHLPKLGLLDIFVFIMIQHSHNSLEIGMVWKSLDAAFYRDALNLQLLRIAFSAASHIQTLLIEPHVLLSICEHMIASDHVLWVDWGCELSLTLFGIFPEIRNAILPLLLNFASKQSNITHNIIFGRIYNPVSSPLDRQSPLPNSQLSTSLPSKYRFQHHKINSKRTKNKKPRKQALNDDKPDFNFLRPSFAETLAQIENYRLWIFPLRTIVQICILFGREAVQNYQYLEDFLFEWTSRSAPVFDHSRGKWSGEFEATSNRVELNNEMTYEEMASVKAVKVHRKRRPAEPQEPTSLPSSTTSSAGVYNKHLCVFAHAISHCLVMLGTQCKTQILNSLMMLLQKQLASSNPASQACGFILATHVLRCLDITDSHLLGPIVLRAFASCRSNVRIFAYDFISHNASILDPHTRSIFFQSLLQAMQKIGPLAGSPHVQQSGMECFNNIQQNLDSKSNPKNQEDSKSTMESMIHPNTQHPLSNPPIEWCLQHLIQWKQSCDTYRVVYTHSQKMLAND